MTDYLGIFQKELLKNHRLEEILNGNKIIRPAYKYVGQHVEFSEIDNR